MTSKEKSIQRDPKQLRSIAKQSHVLDSLREDDSSEKLETVPWKMKGTKESAEGESGSFQEKGKHVNMVGVDDVHDNDRLDGLQDLNFWTKHLAELHLNHEKNNSDARRQRNAMGEFIVADGTKPLTQLAVPTPGPLDYNPKAALSKPSAPSYSIVGKPKYVQESNFPGPNKYKIDKDLIWKDKTITIKGKRKINPEIQNKSNGTAIYNVTHGNLGTVAPRHTIGRKVAICSGPPNSLVQAVDTFGFNTPGPAEYNSNSDFTRNGMKGSFGLKFKMKEQISTSPGPAEYTVRNDNPSAPLYSFGMRLYENIEPSANTPGPGAYQIGTTIGKSVAKSIAGRSAIKKKDNTPSPNTYLLPNSIGSQIRYTMTYRPFDTIAKPSPGPSEYEPKNDNVRKGPKFTCGRRCPLSYPDVLHHWDQSRNLNPNVAPNSYNPNRDFAKNDKPSYSMGKRFKHNVENSPGPANYNIGEKKSGRKNEPAISIGKRIEENIVKCGPGPAAYNPQPTKSGPSYSMSGWNRKKPGAECNDYPAANTYTIEGNQTRRGKGKGQSVTLKGRPSPFAFSGFRRPVQA